MKVYDCVQVQETYLFKQASVAVSGKAVSSSIAAVRKVVDPPQTVNMMVFIAISLYHLYSAVGSLRRVSF